MENNKPKCREYSSYSYCRSWTSHSQCMPSLKLYNPKLQFQTTSTTEIVVILFWIAYSQTDLYDVMSSHTFYTANDFVVSLWLYFSKHDWYDTDT